ncbi:hypothetical protein BAE44_0004489 [Dichanthelium oligosanthes]|uniref:Uncharacterized protein n=1 Tax=Dichanthelium oligosanthes TaxID=888268 RepID=A0A1E5WAS8_9POAL|nr:hypothetical protein BAE44_0004489 [Dichanthelium oligosanthes]
MPDTTAIPLCCCASSLAFSHRRCRSPARRRWSPAAGIRWPSALLHGDRVCDKQAPPARCGLGANCKPLLASMTSSCRRYVSVDEATGTELFYYFMESERSPRTDPLLLWHSGGPRCSAFSALAYQIRSQQLVPR